MSLPNLNAQQQQDILSEWNNRPDNPPSLLELIRVAYPDNPELDGRTKEGKAVKAFLATRQIRARASHEYKHKGVLKLDEEKKEFIVNNAGMMTAVEIARILFKDDKISNLSQETRTVNDFISTLNIESAQNDNSVPQGEYKPPTNADRAITRVNKYVLHGINKNKITAKQKRDINSLIGYLHTYRFLHQINNYETIEDRELFESSFVRYTHDKEDLTQEEVDQYIVLSVEVVIAVNIQRRVEHLQRLLDQSADDSEGRRIAMSLVESINTAQTEYNQSVNRQHKLLGDLKEKRSDKLKSQLKSNASILNLVEMWKEEESRQKMIAIAERRKKIVSEEVDNLSNMDDIKCKILGLSRDEALDG